MQKCTSEATSHCERWLFWTVGPQCMCRFFQSFRMYPNCSHSLAFSYRIWGCLGSANDVSFFRLSIGSVPHRGILLCLEADLAGADLVLSSRDFTLGVWTCMKQRDSIFIGCTSISVCWIWLLRQATNSNVNNHTCSSVTTSSITGSSFNSSSFTNSLFTDSPVTKSSFTSSSFTKLNIIGTRKPDEAFRRQIHPRSHICMHCAHCANQIIKFI